MIEPLFGSAAQTWQTMPSPGLGWAQLTMPLGSRAMSGAAGFGSPQMTATSPSTSPQSSYAPMSFAQPTFLVNPNAGFPLVSNPFGMSAALPAYLSQELAASSSLRALLETVAMRRGQPLGPTNDQECEEFIFDTFELIPSTSEVDVRCESGRITLSGNVQNKRLKHDIGEIAWSIPGVSDVQNNIAIVTRRRARGANREVETPSTGPGRKTA
jgi:BON domain-containing protein